MLGRILLILVFCGCSHVPAPMDREPASAKKFLDGVDGIELAGDLTGLFLAARPESGEEGPPPVPASPPKVKGILKVQATGKVSEFPVEIFVRGNTSLHDCAFPKLRVEFLGETNGTVLNGIRRLPLNTHCSGPTPTGYTGMGRVAGDDGPKREALLYRMLEILEIPAYTSRLVAVKYLDTGGKNSGSRFALALEDKKIFARRMKATVLEDDEDVEELEELLTRIRPEMDGATLLKALLFETMIGNSDYSFMIPDLRGERHYDRVNGAKGLWNVLLLRGEGGRSTLGLTDFDMSLAVRQDETKLDKLSAEITGCKKDLCYVQFTQLQKWRAFFNRNDFAKAISEFKEKKPALLDAITQSGTVDPNAQVFLREMVEGFLRMAEKVHTIPVLQMPGVEVFRDADLKLHCGLEDGDSTHVLAPAGLPVKVLSSGKKSMKVFILDTRDNSMVNPLAAVSCVEEPVWIPATTAIGNDWP